MAHVAGHDLGPAVAVEVDEPRVGDDRHRRRARRAHRPVLEAQRRGVGRGPRLGKRQRLGGARLEVADVRLELVLREAARPPLGDAYAAQAEASHVLQPRAPLRARQVGGRGRRVADRALAAHGLDEGRVGPRVGPAVEAERRRGRRGEGAAGGALRPEQEATTRAAASATAILTRAV